MSLTDLTVRVAVIAAVALGALIAVGWRQPARRRAADSLHPDRTERGRPEPLLPTSEVLKTRLWRVASLGGIAVVVGAVVAMVVSLATAWVVTNIVDRL